MADITALGKHIKENRDKKGWNQAELAERLGVTDRAVSAWEHGRAYPRVAMLDKMCKLFDCRLSDLTEGKEVVAIDPVFGPYYPSGKKMEVSFLENGEEAFLVDTAPVPPDNSARLLKIFKRLTEAQQRKVIDFAIDMMEDENGSKV